MAEVYWIRKPSHTDIFTEGYVGVTSKTAQERYKTHVDLAKGKKNKHSVVHKAINALGAENLVVETICICTEEYAYDLENKLRPYKSIGWNVAIGGDKPPGVKGLPVSEETRKKLSDAMKARPPNPEAAKRGGDTMRGRKLPEEHKQNISKGMMGRKPTEKMLELLIARNKARTGDSRSDESRSKQSESILAKGWWTTKRANKLVWAKADILYEKYLLGFSSITCIRELDYDELLTPTSTFSIWKHFKEGWIPLEDEKWIKDFK